MIHLVWVGFFFCLVLASWELIDVNVAFLEYCIKQYKQH